MKNNSSCWKIWRRGKEESQKVSHQMRAKEKSEIETQEKTDDKIIDSQKDSGLRKIKVR